MHEQIAWDIGKLILAAMIAWIAKDLNGKLKTLIVKVDKLMESMNRHDIQFEHDSNILLQLQRGVDDNRKSLHKAWDEIRTLQTFRKLTRSVHNHIHPDQKINGGD